MFKFEGLTVWDKAIDFADIMIDIADSLPRIYQYSFGINYVVQDFRFLTTLQKPQGDVAVKRLLIYLILPKVLFMNASVL